MSRKCKGCDARLEQPKRGGRKLWCSERCRKRTCYSGSCSICGARTQGIASGYKKESKYCVPCAKRVQRTTGALQHAAFVADLEALWAEGLTMAQRRNGAAAARVAKANREARRAT